MYLLGSTPSNDCDDLVSNPRSRLAEAYLAYSTERVSRTTETLIWPG